MIPPTLALSRSSFGPALEKLEANPGSVILIAVESAEAHCNFCRVTWAWLSREERKALRAALLKAKKKRDAARSRNHRQGDSCSRQEGPPCDTVS